MLFSIVFFNTDSEGTERSVGIRRGQYDDVTILMVNDAIHSKDKGTV